MRKLVPNTPAASTAATAIVVATSALRTGTAVFPWPGWNAMRAPTLAVTEPASARAGPCQGPGRGEGGSGNAPAGRAPVLPPARPPGP